MNGIVYFDYNSKTTQFSAPLLLLVPVVVESKFRLQRFANLNLFTYWPFDRQIRRMAHQAGSKKDELCLSELTSPPILLSIPS